ncbi:YicC/YloC family endoribonuclease [Phenylobacterium montanum]|uniref:YicC family protein n=1 Tax=Phenylobacterium montanum TaxID=2823693 RepID=A0A975G0S1_9CAUL|nr:YicC/YloC family endoribonuclease [Caulobacter sp. S6]QUD89000.1 YicC family protein [Caulobacter sp. S6]
MAISGMTGFARADGAEGAWSWTVEARSVNGRSLEARFRGPPGFDSLDRAARDAAQARFQRGQINIALQAKRAEGLGAVRVNATQLEAFLALAEPYVRDGRASPPAFDGILALRGVIEASDEGEDAEVRAAVEAAMAASLAEALDGLKVARLEEGAALAPVLAALADKIETLVAQAEGEAKAQPVVLKERFERRMAELLGERADLQERVVQEAAALASRADVREELDRLTSHVAAARTLLATDDPVGRKLDFLTQEFMREANTLCSKSATTALTAVGLELKATIDQLREQVQNVE